MTVREQGEAERGRGRGGGRGRWWGGGLMHQACFPVPWFARHLKVLTVLGCKGGFTDVSSIRRPASVVIFIKRGVDVPAVANRVSPRA